MTDESEHLLAFDDLASAEAIAGILRHNGVPVRVEPQSPVPGLVENVYLVVPKNLAHRARWILRSDKLTDRELEFVATGMLPANIRHES